MNLSDALSLQGCDCSEKSRNWRAKTGIHDDNCRITQNWKAFDAMVKKKEP